MKTYKVKDEYVNAIASVKTKAGQIIFDFVNKSFTQQQMKNWFDAGVNLFEVINETTSDLSPEIEVLESKLLIDKSNKKKKLNN